MTLRDVFFMDINSHYSQIQLALFSKALPHSTGSSFIFLFRIRGSHFSFFFLLFEPSYSALETRELLGQEMESELQINQSCLMSSYCNTQTDVTGDWWTPHLHVQLLTGRAGISFCSYFVVTFNSDWYHLLTASFCSLQCSGKEANLFLRLQSH